MTRAIVLLLAIAATSSGAFAQAAVVPKAPKAFDIFIDQKTGLESVANVELNGFTTDYAFGDSAKSFALMYLVLPRSENAIEYEAQSIYVLLESLLSRVVGRTILLGQISKYPKEEVASLTNGDFGISAFVANASDEPEGRFKYELINVFYKRDYGTVCQILASKKLDFFKSGTFVNALQSFKFPGIRSK